MSLDFNFTGMTEEAQNNEHYCWQEDGQVTPVSHAIIFSCIGTGIGVITEKNVDEFYARMSIYNNLGGPGSLYENGKERMVTMEELYDHIGLRTNVALETRVQWTRRLFVSKQTSITEDNVRYYRRWRGKKYDDEIKQLEATRNEGR